jgi:hypothetical protein
MNREAGGYPIWGWAITALGAALLLGWLGAMMLAGKTGDLFFALLFLTPIGAVMLFHGRWGRHRAGERGLAGWVGRHWDAVSVALMLAWMIGMAGLGPGVYRGLAH